MSVGGRGGTLEGRLEEIRSTYALARDRGLVFFTAYNRRYDPAWADFGAGRALSAVRRTLDATAATSAGWRTHCRPRRNPRRLDAFVRRI